MTIYKGIGTGRCDNEGLVDFLNYVFGMDGTANSFYTLLPKLYKPEYHPENHNYVIMEDGRLRAAVGAFPFSLKVAGETLRGAGFGNVAVHPMHRSKGYMVECMNMAIDAVVKSGADFAVLGGRRQRYSYFGFEPAGVYGSFTVNTQNMRHVYGPDWADTGFEVHKLTESDTTELARIRSLSDSRSYAPVRDTASYFDILSSWNAKIYSVNDKSGEFTGYFIYGGDDDYFNVMEIDCTRRECAPDVLRACFKEIGQDGVNFSVPQYNAAFYDLLSDIAESVTIANGEHFCVYNYEKVIRSTMALKAEYAALADGELTLDIEGFSGREIISITVRDGLPHVERLNDDKEVNCERSIKLTHRQAMGVLFGLSVPEKRLLPGFAAGWFPLPLLTLGVDNC